MRSAGFKAFTISRSSSVAFLILFKPSKLNSKIEKKKVIVIKVVIKEKAALQINQCYRRLYLNVSTSDVILSFELPEGYLGEPYA